ncbi:glutathione S-transferase family protein [Enterovirga rhinocerotis]|uniref:Glutathione S-transferase n=1 Tax=Enterovirga rhinocerotis TaxID=1339210 RepID=A0A4R7BTI2_9HYPH|nr:glutathione S-transferase family protein [Enterovirga rhinocerotis]TDR89058.1 glutathione S-transferase [Enterovirga rhinocerotis]
MPPTLVIANKLYSSWSLRPWLLLREAQIPFEEILVPLGRDDTRERIQLHSPAGKVPVLIDDGVTIWDSLAIVEYAAERWPEAGIWPGAREGRALARSISAEMHSGFSGLRRACPMNLGKRFAGRDRGEQVANDVRRIEAIWADARARFGQGGPFLFGAFCAADAMYAPVITRLDTYGFAVSSGSRAYMDAVLGLPSYKEWLAEALKEPWVVDVDEVDEPPAADLRTRTSP